MYGYMDPTSDFGFKKLFGDENNLDLTTSFLNDLLEPRRVLRDVRFLDKEQLPPAVEHHSGIFDLFCRDSSGDYFIVEMQKREIHFLTNRMVFYASFPIAAQARRGALPFILDDREFPKVAEGRAPYGKQASSKSLWNYNIKAVYCIAVLAFSWEGSTKVINWNSLRNDEPPHAQFNDRIRLVTVELPLFDERKPEYSLDRHLNKWLYFLKYVHGLSEMPKFYRGDPVFEKAFAIAELGRLSFVELIRHENSLCKVRDAYAEFEFSFEKGEKSGMTKGEVRGKIAALAMFLEPRLGPIPHEIENELRRHKDLSLIDRLLAAASQFKDWGEVQKTLQTAKGEATD